MCFSNALFGFILVASMIAFNTGLKCMFGSDRDGYKVEECAPHAYACAKIYCNATRPFAIKFCMDVIGGYSEEYCKMAAPCQQDHDIDSMAIKCKLCEGDLCNNDAPPTSPPALPSTPPRTLPPIANSPQEPSSVPDEICGPLCIRLKHRGGKNGN